MLIMVMRNQPERTWHINQAIHLTDREVLDVQLVQADGDELQYIQLAMDNVPIATHKRVNRWYGDMAKFIAANL